MTGVEASLTACIAGMNDLSGSVAQYFGAWLTTLCGVTAVDFKQVWVIFNNPIENNSRDVIDGSCYLIAMHTTK